MSKEYKKYFLLFSVIVFVGFFVVPVPSYFDVNARYTLAVLFLMAVWWIWELVPLSVTAMLPIVVFPILWVRTISEATAPFANPLIYLFLWWFVISIAMQKTGLHKNIAYNIIKSVWTSPRRIIIWFMIACAFLSMRVSNTATALMMLPVALSIVALVETSWSIKKRNLDHNFSVCLLLGIAYACNIWWVWTLVWTPPNALMAGFLLDNYGINISFVDWMWVGVPVILITLPLVYVLLTYFLFPINISNILSDDYDIKNTIWIKKMDNKQKIVLMVFVFVVMMWLFQSYLAMFVPGLSDAGIAIFAAILLFVLPWDIKNMKAVLEWDDMKSMPWWILILFGWWLSLAGAISSSGLDAIIWNVFGELSFLPVLVLVFAIFAMVVFLTEITSNTATASVLIPIFAILAGVLWMDIFFIVALVALWSSFAFMLPVATPPNAVVYSSGYIPLGLMVKAGIFVNILMIIIVPIIVWLLSVGY